MTSREDATEQIARRVVTGLGDDGRSRIVEDAPTRPWTRRPNGSLVMDLWRVDELPTPTAASSTAGEDVVLAPPEHGVVVRTSVFPPDSAVTPEQRAAYEAAMGDLYGDQGDSSKESAVPGTHMTDTIDVVTVVDGEIWVVLEDGETCLRQGDTIVQRGTRHAWQNRSERPVTVVTTMLPATRG